MRMNSIALAICKIHLGADRFTLSVLPAIRLDDQSSALANEIGNERADRLLAAEL